MNIEKLQSMTEEGKDELALALLLWRDFKSKGRFDTDLIITLFELADMLGIKKNLEQMMVKLPPMVITPRDSQCT